MASTCRPEVSAPHFADERAEYKRVAAFPPLMRAPSLSRIFAFVCKKYFEGRIDEIKEYNIAVHALGRPENFDSGSDPIVRVSMCSLRKRLEQYYAIEGKNHRLQITFPVGHYVPEFVRLPDATNKLTFSGKLTRVLSRPQNPLLFPRIRTVAALMVLVALAVLAFKFLPRHHFASTNMAEVHAGGSNLGSVVAAGGLSARVLRIAPGATQDYTDSSGFLWTSGQYCTGGHRFRHAGHQIAGASESALFQSGLEGAAECAIPEPPGTYEVHLLFADTTAAAEAAHHFLISLNQVQEIPLDIVDEAEGNDRAVTKVLTDIHPQIDGKIHIGLESDSSFVNGIEIYPGIPGHMLPLRIVAGSSTFTDSQGHTWLSDRYFFGGSEARRGFPTQGAFDPHLYEWEHYGHFRYVLPVATGERYEVTLYFSEGYFGPGKMVSGGYGSRIFNVNSGGRTLLENFDILSETTPGHETVVKTFHNVQPSALGQIELEFEPVRDYPVVNAIEVEPEASVATGER